MVVSENTSEKMSKLEGGEVELPPILLYTAKMTLSKYPLNSGSSRMDFMCSATRRGGQAYAPHPMAPTRKSNQLRQVKGADLLTEDKVVLPVVRSYAVDQPDLAFQILQDRRIFEVQVVFSQWTMPWSGNCDNGDNLSLIHCQFLAIVVEVVFEYHHPGRVDPGDRA